MALGERAQFAISFSAGSVLEENPQKIFANRGIGFSNYGWSKPEMKYADFADFIVTAICQLAQLFD